MRNNTVFLLFFLLSVASLRSQSEAFHYSCNALINLNPSFAGSNGNLRVQGLASNNVSRVGSETHTFYNAADMYLPSIKSGLALTAYQDNSSHRMFKTNSYGLSYAKYLSLRDDKIKLVPSIQIGLRQRRIAYSFFHGYSASSDKYVYVNEHITVALGGLANIRNFYFGASFYNFQPITRREQHKRFLDRYNFHASYNLRAADWALLHFSGNVSVNSFFYSSLNLGLNALLFKHVVVGGGIQERESYFLNTGYRGHCFSLSLGYDKSISRLRPYQYQGWTAMATFNLRKKELRKEVLNFEAW